MIAILVAVICCFVVLSCISLMPDDVEQHVISLLAMSMSSLVDCLFKSFAYFLTGVWPAKLDPTSFSLSS